MASLRPLPADDAFDGEGEGGPFGDDVILVVDIEHPPRYLFLMVLLTFPRNLSVYDSFRLNRC